MKETFAPKWAPHASGTFDRGVDEEGKPIPTWIELRCASCGATHRVHCDSGAPRRKVLAWATVHVHRDPLASPFPKE